MSESRKVPAPIFTLRGHNFAVTALTEYNYCEDGNNETYLISGDEDGTIIVWDIEIYRTLISYKNSFESRIQSLRVVNLLVENIQTNVLVVQTRDQGIFVIDISYNIKNAEKDPKLKQIAAYSTYPSIFSKGDAINISGNDGAILAYPSYLENYLITVRIIGPNAKTILSGTAQRDGKNEKKPTVFDVKLKSIYAKDNDLNLLAVAYEDGHLCVFSFSSKSTKTVPHLQSTGLDIELVKNYNLEIGDFITAFDLLIDSNFDKLTVVIGTPLTELICLNDSLKSSNLPNIFKISLKRQGISSVKIRPDEKLFVAGCWDNMIRLYSMKGKKLLATLSHHSKQAHDLLFVEKIKHNVDQQTTSNSENKKFLLYCASMEGTISITSIY